LYLTATTSFANFQQDAPLIDPAGFTARPKDPLVAAPFAIALPSPAFLATRLDAQRPMLITQTRVAPVVESAAYQGSTAGPAVIVVNPPPPPPVVVVNQPVTEVPVPQPVPYPVPVVVAVTTVPSPAPPAKPQTASAPQGRGQHLAIQPRIHPREMSSHESELASEAIKHVTTGDFEKAVPAIDRWADHYPRSQFAAERLYYYIVAYNGVNQPAKVVDVAHSLLLNGRLDLLDARQLILALYLTSLNAQKLPRPTRDQRATIQESAQVLLASVPDYFTVPNKPQTMTFAEWQKARSEVEAAGKAALARR